MNSQSARFEAPHGLFAKPAELAHLDPFELAGVAVVPAERRIVAPDGREGVLEPLVMQVLVALARARGQTLSRDDLIADCWGRRIVGDDAVNRVMSRLRRSLSEVAGDRIRIATVAKVGYRLEVEDGQGTCTSALAAAGDVPPHDRSRARPRLAALAAVLGGAAALTVATVFIASPASSVAISITPAAGVEGDVHTARFASDLTTDIAELTGSLTRMTLIEPDRPSDADMTLRVALGDPETSDAASVSLFDAANGALIWTRKFDGAGATEADLRERAAHAVAGVIRCGLDKSAGNLGDAVSKRLYFAACDAVERRDWPTAYGLAQQIAERRPEIAGSWACLALTRARVGGATPAARNQAARESMAHARKALGIDQRSGLAHQALAVALEMQGQSGFDAIEQGVRLDPEHAGLLAQYSWELGDMGYADASVAPATKAMVLDPGDIFTAVARFYALVAAGRVPEARQLITKAERLWPADRNVTGMRNTLLFYDRNPAAAPAAYHHISSEPVAVEQVERDELAWRSDPARFDWRDFDRHAAALYRSDPAAAWSLAFSATRMADRTRALYWLERSRAQPGTAPWFLLFWPDAAALRRDPRFFAKMAEVGLVDQWRQRDRWPDFCSDPQLTYDCRREAARLAKGGTA